MLSILTRCRFPWTAALALTLASTGTSVWAQAGPVPAPPSIAAPPTLPPPPPPQAPPPNLPPPPVKGGPAGVAAVVNGQQITDTQLSKTALQLSGTQALKVLIVDTLIAQAAAKQGITVTPAQLDARMAILEQEVNSSYPGGFTAFIASQDSSLAAIRDNVRVDMLAEDLATKGQAPVHRVHVHYLVVLTVNPNGSPTIKPHTQAEAKAIIAQAQHDLKAGMTFEAVAAKYSEDPGKNNGGDLLGQDGQPMVLGPENALPNTAASFDPTFVNAALALKPGEITPTPVYSPKFGYFLIEAVSTSEHPMNVVTKKSDEVLYFKVEQADARNAAQAYLRTLLQNAKITSYFMP